MSTLLDLPPEWRPEPRARLWVVYIIRLVSLALLVFLALWLTGCESITDLVKPCLPYYEDGSTCSE